MAMSLQDSRKSSWAWIVQDKCVLQIPTFLSEESVYLRNGAGLLSRGYWYYRIVCYPVICLSYFIGSANVVPFSYLFIFHQAALRHILDARSLKGGKKSKRKMGQSWFRVGKKQTCRKQKASHTQWCRKSEARNWSIAGGGDPILLDDREGE